MFRFGVGKPWFVSVLFSWLILFTACNGDGTQMQDEQSNQGIDHQAIVKDSRKLIPLPPWPDGDQRGMANTLGAGTWMRCAYHLNQSNARVYEL